MSANNLKSNHYAIIFFPLGILLVFALFYLDNNFLFSASAVSFLNLGLVVFALISIYFQHIIFRIYFAYHLLTMVFPIFIATLLYSQHDVLLFLRHCGITEKDLLKSNLLILLFDFVFIVSIVFFNKLRLVKKSTPEVLKYYLNENRKYLLIVIIASLSYAMKLYLVKIGAWFTYIQTDLTQYPFASIADVLQKLDILVLLYFAYNYRYDKSKLMMTLMITIISISLFFAVISTSKEKLFMVLIPVVLLLLQTKYKKIYSILVFLFFINSGILFDYFLYLRYHPKQPITQSTAEFLHVRDKTGEARQESIFENTLLIRLGYQFVFSRAVKVYDYDNFSYKSDYLNNITGLVPRILWPSKPVIGINGNKIGHDLGLLAKADTVTSVGMTPLGEAFYELRYWGMTIVPIFVAFILYYLTQKLNETYWIGFLLSIMFGLAIATTDWYNTLIPTLLKFFIMFYIFGFLLNRNFNGDEIRLKFSA